MDLNLVVLGGRLAAPGAYRRLPSGVGTLQLLVSVRHDGARRRVDVIPATVWNPDPELVRACKRRA